jgi:MinD superfamily P-loop ATPase
LFLPRGKQPQLLGECNGCEACIQVCEAHAISRGRKQVGMTYLSRIDGLSLYTGALIPGFEESSVVVQAVRERAFADAEQFDLILVDTSPGAHCNVINALRGADSVLAVTEPTPFGLHDLELILNLLELLELGGSVVLNRADLPGDRKKIKTVARQHSREMIWEIGMDDLLARSYAAGVPVVREYPLAPSSKVFQQLAENIAATYAL